MKILALELSTNRGSVALAAADGACDMREFANDRKHSGGFFAALEELIDGARDIDRIVVGLGPGSYAGTRIAISAAVGLQAASGAELLGLPSVCALETDTAACVVIGDARQGAFSFTRVEGGAATDGPLLLDERALRERLREAGLPVYASHLMTAFPETTIAFPSARRLADLARGETPRGSILPPLQPLYLRDPHITVSKQPVWHGAV